MLDFLRENFNQLLLNMNAKEISDTDGRGFSGICEEITLNFTQLVQRAKILIGND